MLADEVVEGGLRVELKRPQLSGPWPRHLVGLVAEALEAERVGEAPGRVDRDHARAPPDASSLKSERGGDRGLPHATRAAADHDVVLAKQGLPGDRLVGQVLVSPVVVSPVVVTPVVGHEGSASTPTLRASDISPSSSGPITSPGMAGTRTWRRGSSSARRRSCSSCSSWRLAVNSAAAPSALQQVFRHLDTCVLGGIGGIRAKSLRLWQARVDDEGPETHPYPVLELVRGLDGLVHWHLLGERDERHAAAVGVGKELGDVGGLGAKRP